MNPLADDLLVALVLALSLCYAVMKLGPRSFRRIIQAAAARGLAVTPAVFRLRGLAQRFAVASVQLTKGACGGCDNCAAPPPASPQASAVNVSVPLAKIGRRSER